MRHLKAARAPRLILLISLFAASLVGFAHAQQTATIAREGEPLLGEVGGARLGQLALGGRFQAGTSRAGYTQITLEGWIFKPSTGAARKDGHTLAVRRAPVENLRDAPNGKTLAQLVQGFLLDEVDHRGQWLKVRRLVWVKSDGLQLPGQVVAAAPPAAPDGRAAPSPPPAAPNGRAAPAPPPAATVPDTTPADPRRAVVRRRMNLYRAPDSAAVGQLEAGTPVRITERAGPWVRIETQAWVRENEIRPSDNSILTGLTASELRGAPDEFKGKLLRWTIQFLSLQTADELRPDFQPGQKYILARGPAPEYAFVYVIVPADKLLDVQKIEPLASITVVARVVNGRSTYLANPILELVELP
ncbi:MAG TPA: SH3 domain-containing protein [Gemmatimonadales bacterium]|jgi:hypothetical protein